MADNPAVDIRAPESFFDDHPEFKMNLYPLMEEIKHLSQEPSEQCRDYFYRCMAEPRIRAMIERQPFAEAAITSRLVNVLTAFKNKVGALVEECGTEIEATLREQMQEIDGLYGQERPYFEALLTRRVQPFVDNNRRARANATLHQVNAVVNNLIWQPLADIEDAAVVEPQIIRQDRDSEDDRPNNRQHEDEPLDIEEVNFQSSKPAAVEPQMSTINFTCIGDSDEAKAIEVEADKVV